MDELYVLARRVLLDAIEALGQHRDAVIVVGAQAVYLRTGEADLAVAPTTTDADLVIDPVALGPIPPLEQALKGAGFMPRAPDSVGVWITHRSTSASPRTEVAVDLLVPASLSSGRGRRAADLIGHDRRAARIVRGLEGAVVDADVIGVASLEAADSRVVSLHVAGSAALLVAKLHKIQERMGTGRQIDKDALDVLRLLRGTSTNELETRYRRLQQDPRSRDGAGQGLSVLKEQFSSRRAAGVEMMVRAAGSLADPEELGVSCEVLVSDLLSALGE